MIESGRYTSGRIAVADLSATIDSFERRHAEEAVFEDLLALSKLLFLRGDLLGRIVDHDRGESAATEAVLLVPDAATGIFIRARLASRFHRFKEASAMLDEALAAGYAKDEVDSERASLLQATGHYEDALFLRQRLAKHEPGIHTFGALASLLAEMDQWAAAEARHAAALDVDACTSPLPCGQLLFEWGVSAMRRGDLERAETVFAELDTILPQHVPGRGHRSEVALALRQFDLALKLIEPLLGISDDPEYRATYAEVLEAGGDREAAEREAELAATAYDRLLERRPEAFADHAAAFFIGIGNRPQFAVDLARANWMLRDTPRSRRLLGLALQKAQQPSWMGAA